MRNRIWFLFLILGTAFFGSAQSEGSKKWQPVTVCDLVKNRSYDGARVMFHARVLDGQLHGILLKDVHCDKGLRMTASDSVREQEDYKEFMRTIYSTRKIAGDHTITADFYGRFVYRPAEPRLKWALDVERISNIEVSEEKVGGAGATPR